MHSRSCFSDLLVASATVLGCFAVSTTAVQGQTDRADGKLVEETWISYAAKFVCGNEIDINPAPSIVLGKYRTAVNIHNPHYLVDAASGGPLPVIFYKKVVRALPQGNVPFPPTCKQEERLNSDAALMVDCENIKSLLELSGQPTTGDKEGFVVIEVPAQGLGTPPPLDVVAVYTARNRTDPDDEIETLDVERVEATTVIGQPDLNNLCTEQLNGP